MRKVLVAAVFLLILTPGESSAQNVIVKEFELKARLLAIIGDFFTWPADVAPADAKPLIIGVLGEDPFDYPGGNNLDDSVARRLQREGKAIQVKRFDSVKDYQPCHVLFISRFTAPNSVEKTMKQRMTAVNNQMKGKSVLIVTDAPGHAQRGAAANMVINGNNVQLEVNPTAATRHNLKARPQLLRAVNVVADPPPNQ